MAKLIRRLNRELKSDLQSYNDLNTIRERLVLFRMLTKVTTKLSLILGLSTGRRLSELLVNAKFEPTTKQNNELLERVLFSGVAKKREDNLNSFRIPIIGLNANEVIYYSTVLKILLPDSLKELLKNGMELREISNRFQSYIRKNWNEFSDFNIDDMRDCRGAYALYCNLIDNNGKAITEAYIQSILLHDSKESASHYWTKFKMIK